jgi:hypothetical protein
MGKHGWQRKCSYWDKKFPVLSPRENRLKIKAKSGVQTQKYDGRTTELLSMLRYMRPAKSETEQSFVNDWIVPLGTTPDGYGNHWLTIGESPILWSCHTDTVHRQEGMQYVSFHEGCAYVTSSSCLGADDTTGCWIMRNMILAGVPGTYVFHREEEIGGRGSYWVASETPERVNGFLYAIAFDRMGYRDIITDQCGNTASPAFAGSLATALEPLPYMGSDQGIFTDTQSYMDLIPECSNVSVGYHGQHTSSEFQDVDFAMVLLDTVLSADFSKLTATRDPTVIDDWRYFAGERHIGYQNGLTVIGDKKKASIGWELDEYTPPDAWDDEQLGLKYGYSIRTLDELCRQYPAVVADFIESLGYTVDDLKSYGSIK